MCYLLDGCLVVNDLSVVLVVCDCCDFAITLAFVLIVLIVICLLVAVCWLYLVSVIVLFGLSDECCVF